jgi:hypothetical protein
MNKHMIRTLAAVALATLGTLSCSGANETQAASKPVAEAPPILDPSDAAIPSQEDADAAAEKAINDANADAELEKLEKELESGTGGG